MYYRLDKRFLLRGWEKLPYAVVNRSNGHIQFANKETMQVLEAANGKIDFDIPLINDITRQIAEKLVSEGILIASVSADPIDEKQKYHFFENRFMSSAHWSITGRCNYKCKHCYMSACENKYDELDHETIMRIVDDLASCGIYRVNLTGGEPLVRKDFFEIVDALTARDITIEQIYSNGLLVNEKLLTGLRDRGLCPEFNMSFDGTEGWHAWLRGVPEAGKTIDRAFRLCREYGFPTGAEMCIHEKNKHTLRDSVNYLAEVGCSNLKTNPISDVGAWHDGGYGQSISTEELFEVYLDYIPKYLEDGKPLSIHLGGFFLMNKDKDFYRIPAIKQPVDLDVFCVCGHARNQLYISAEGRALPCMSLSGMDIQNNYPLIPEHGLKYCLSESTYIDLVTKKAREVINHNERCINCEYAASCCGGCRASALFTTPDDIMGIDEAACLTIRGGYAERIEAAVKSVAPEVNRK